MENTAQYESFDKLERAKLACSTCGDPLWYDELGKYHCVNVQDHHAPVTQSGFMPKAI